MTLVKICGLTNSHDALSAVEHGADAVGFVFAEHSPRCADPETVASIAAELPRRVTAIGVFQDQPVQVVRDVVLGCGLHVAQLHGAEGSDYFQRLGVPILKAFGVRTAEDAKRIRECTHVEVALLDSAHLETDPSGVARTVSGGTGQTFEWSWLEGGSTRPRLVLGGGLRPENVRSAIRAVFPWAVDVSSGVEAEPGRKDPGRVRAFIEAAKATRPASVETAEQAWGTIVPTGPAESAGLGATAPGSVTPLQMVLRRLRARGRKCLVPYFVADYPDRHTFVRLLLAAQAAGADAVEVGVPTREPKLDGPTIRHAMEAAVAQGAGPEAALNALDEARALGLTIPAVFMMYEPLYREAGGARFAAQAARRGVSAMLVVDPDRPYAPCSSSTRRSSRTVDTLGWVNLVGPRTSESSLKTLLGGATGFAYCVSVRGGTGGEEASLGTARSIVGRVRRVSDIPALVGFGVRSPRIARGVAEVADGVVIGSVLLEAVAEAAEGPGDPVAAAGGLLRRFRRAVDEAI